MLTAAGKRVRVAVLAVAAALLLAGTVWGTDDAFPFGPFRMYATADDPDGRVLSTRLVAVTEDGREVAVTEDDIGLRRAEYEGQLSSLVERPAVLAQLAEARAKRHPDRPRFVEVRIVQRTYELVDGAPTSESERVVAVWRASP